MKNFEPWLGVEEITRVSTYLVLLIIDLIMKKLNESFQNYRTDTIMGLPKWLVLPSFFRYPLKCIQSTIRIRIKNFTINCFQRFALIKMINLMKYFISFLIFSLLMTSNWRYAVNFTLLISNRQNSCVNFYFRPYLSKLNHFQAKYFKKSFMLGLGPRL